MGLLDTIALLVSMIPGILFAAAILLAQVHYIHVLQLEGYVNKNYFKWLRVNIAAGFLLPVISFAMVLAVEILNRTNLLPFVRTDAGTIVSIAVLIGAAGLMLFYAGHIRFKQAKKPLVYTARVKRLFIGIIALFAVLFFILEIFLNSTVGYLVLLTPLLAPAGNLLMRPVESAVKRHYFNDAKAKLAAKEGLIRIGITGSYGKTSTKFILGAILSEKFATLVPPQSYNTPMGLTRVIREQMKSEHEVFIAEMGARHVGDIAELCDLVHPQYAILTSVGPQHLETFFTIENVMSTKYELIEGLPQDGVAVFNVESEYVRQLYLRTEKKKIGYAFFEREEADLWVRETKTTPEGSMFEVEMRGGSRFWCKTKLLGRHNILNILGGIALAIELKLSPEEIARGVARVEPVEHRLQILKTGNGVTVIDDAFNSNPEGAASAIEVIGQFSGRKIVVTPGMVELGEKEDIENYKFGQTMSSVCDFVFLVGPKHTRPIYNGLAESGFPIQNIFIAKTLEEASAQMTGILRTGDVVLFENDLPDNYNE
jgi:UDP-N-acetylmuramoyl-tripeptide--D-alanyl-D-alanine ligase